MMCKTNTKNDGDNDEIIISMYNRNEHGKEAGILWIDGMWEMMGPFYRNTVLHSKVVISVSALWAVHGAWLLRNGLSSEEPLTNSILLLLSQSIWSYAIPISFLVLLVLFWLYLQVVVKYKVSKRLVCIDDPKPGETAPEWKEHWVALTSEPNGNQTVVGCVTLSRQKSQDNINDNKGETKGVRDIKNNNNKEEKESSKEEVEWWLSHLTVAPSHRRKGLASKMADMVEEKAKHQGADSIRILVGNVNSRQFWHERNYKCTSVKWKVLGHESIFMERPLQ